jgi:hypothetical protein
MPKRRQRRISANSPSKPISAMTFDGERIVSTIFDRMKPNLPSRISAADANPSRAVLRCFVLAEA